MSLSNFSAGNERFNTDAVNWDANPVVLEATQNAFKCLSPVIERLSKVSDNKGLEVLEVGCGTGLLTTKVSPLVKSLVAVDPAAGMVELLKSKVATEHQLQNIIPLCQTLADPEDAVLPPADSAHPTGSRRKFDLIISHLVLHHIPDLEPFLKVLLGCLKPGGHVALTDFEDCGPNSMWFHPPSKLEGVERHGIQRGWFANLMVSAGFVNVNVWTGWTMDVSTKDWEGAPPTMPFPFLMCEGTRP